MKTLAPPCRSLLGLFLAASAAAETVALVGGEVITLDGKALDVGTVVIRDGRIASVKAGKDAPEGSRVVDVSGKIVTPGLIAADTHLGVEEVSLEASTVDYRVGGSDTNNAAFRIVDGINPRSVLIPVQRVEGVTSAISTPQGGLVMGQSAWIDLTRPDRDRMVVRRSLGLHAALGEAGGGAARGSRGYAVLRLREMLNDAATYLKTRAAYDRNQSRTFSGSRLDLEALGKVVSGNQPLVINAHREADLLAALDLAREMGIKIIINGGAEAWRVAPQLAKARVSVLVDPANNLPFSFDALGSRLETAAMLHAAGVRVGITLGGEAHNVRVLRQRAGIAVAHGLPHDEALAAASRNVAQAFGMDKDYGTLTAGKVANIVVWSGDPLELSTQVERVFVQGEQLPVRSRQTDLRDRYRRLPE